MNGREKWRHWKWGWKAERGVLGRAGGLVMPWGSPVLTAPLRAPQHGRCVFAGWQGSNPCCSRPEVLVGGACAARAAALHRCFRSLQPVPVCTVIAGFRVCALTSCLQHLIHPDHHSLLSPACPTFYFLCFVFVSLFQNFPILLTIPVLPIFFQSQGIPLAFHQLPVSHLSPGFCPFSCHPVH